MGAAHNALVANALEALAIAGYKAWKSDSGVWFSESGRDDGDAAHGRGGKKGIPHKYGKKGGGDITLLVPVNVLYNGRERRMAWHAEAEAKVLPDTQSDNQEKHEKYLVIPSGGIYIVFYSVDELMQKLREAVYG